jgi:hypothetical protein
LPDDHTGGTATCVRCGTAAPVRPAAEEEAIPVELAEGRGPESAQVTRRPPGREPTCPDCGKEIPAQARFCPHCNARLEVRRRRHDEDDDERPQKHRRWKPCPRCGCTRAEEVTFTFWGSFYGPALLSHVRCRDCGYAYNGRTGKSNFWPALLFVLVPALLIIAVIGGLILWVWYSAHGAV